MQRHSALFQLHLDIDERVRRIRDERPDWQCAKGCDSCCRRLAAVPRLTAVEWNLLEEGLAALPPERLEEIGRNIEAVAAEPTGPVVCPLLDRSTGACPVYLHRPVACRSYGFYVQRELGLYCGDIEARVASGELADVVWGNHDAVDQRLAAMGEARELTEWFADWPGKSVTPAATPAA